MTARTLRIAVGSALALVATLIPFPYQVCPNWDVTVVDTSGNPLPSMVVRLSYQNHSVEREPHEENQTTDSQRLPVWQLER